MCKTPRIRSLEQDIRDCKSGMRKLKIRKVPLAEGLDPLTYQYNAELLRLTAELNVLRKDAKGGGIHPPP